MRSKRLFHNKFLYFQHAPPYTNLDEISPEKMVKPPFTGAPKHMCSVYYYWWAFLRESEDYIACCANDGVGPLSKLYDAFGDVRNSDFMAWWCDGGRDLFAEPGSVVEFLPDLPASHDNKNRVLVSIDLATDIDRIVSELRERLRDARAVRSDASSNNGSRAKYQVTGVPRLSALEWQLRVYRLRARYDQVTKVQIARQIGLLKENEIDIKARANSVSAQVSEYYSNAKRLMANITKGRFPDYSEDDLFS